MVNIIYKFDNLIFINWDNINKLIKRYKKQVSEIFKILLFGLKESYRINGNYRMTIDSYYFFLESCDD